MPETVPLVCQQCGAPIEVDVDQRQCVCAHCGTSNVVIRTVTGVISSASASGSESVERQLEAVRLEDELAQIDREWRGHRLKYRFTKDDGSEFTPPTREGVRSACTVAIIAGLGIAAIGLITHPMLCLVGIPFAAMAFYAYRKGIEMADSYAIAEKGYRLRRGAVLAKLQSLANPKPPPPSRTLAPSLRCPMCARRISGSSMQGKVTCRHCSTSFTLETQTSEAV